MGPCCTEAIWQQLGQFGAVRCLNGQAEKQKWLMRSSWPEADSSHQDAQIETQFASFVAALGALREIRARQGIKPKDTVRFMINCDAETVALLEPMRPYFKALAGAECEGLGTSFEDLQVPPAQISVDGMEVSVDLGDFIDLNAELTRNEKLEANLTKQVGGKEAKLSNDNFISRAPEDVVAKEREALEDLKKQLATVQETLKRIREALGE